MEQQTLGKRHVIQLHLLNSHARRRLILRTGKHVITTIDNQDWDKCKFLNNTDCKFNYCKASLPDVHAPFQQAPQQRHQAGPL